MGALFTDYWAGAAIRTLARLTGSGKVGSLAGRYHRDLEGAAVRSWNWRALSWEAGLRRAQKKGKAEQFLGFIEVGRRFAVSVREELKRGNFLEGKPVLFAYDTGALEAMEWAREQEVPCVLNQMDPNRVEEELVLDEAKRWPGWADQPAGIPEEYFQRREREWALADSIVVNSEFCRSALLKQGVPAEKMTVVPLCYEPAGIHGPISEAPAPARKSCGPLRVLFLGQVILRKGIQYLIQAARSLERENIQFDIVGPVGISSEAVASAPKNMFFHGRVARDEAARWYRQADVFVLPTLSDGFAITQLEAMAHGLPVITTPCCGEVVSDGLDGFIVPARRADSLALTLKRYLGEPKLLHSQRASALEKSRQFTLERLAENLLSLEQRLLRRSRAVAANSESVAGHV